MTLYFGFLLIVALVTVQEPLLVYSTIPSSDPEIICAVKTLKLSSLTGKWKYLVSQNGFPPEFSKLNSSVVLNIELDGFDGVKITPFGYEDKFISKYVQPDSEENPGNLVTQLALSDDDDVLEIPLTILAFDPERYLAIYSSYKHDWGLFVRPNVRKLTMTEFKNLARAIKCVGVDLKKKNV